SGIGTISLFVSKYAKDVTGVEVVPSAVENARENAVLNNITNTTFYLDNAKNPMDKYINGKDVVIVDPPRKGLSSSLVESLKKADIKKLVYISCGPSTLARDLALLKDYYHFDTIYPVDMFPYTMHVETVVLMSRVNTPE
ncbi:MAG: methyltransferase, partial [Solobacterium sp.]|nr:methyltransferase [Solobacterium sp.]